MKMVRLNANPTGFSVAKIGTQKGKVFVVTGANTGLGLETSKVLASKGATVVMACRDLKRSAKAFDSVKTLAEKSGEGGSVVELQLDLSSLASVAKAADEFKAMNLPLHCLVNNAGVMMCPKETTTDGFEKQFGTNHLGHFAFTAKLFPVLQKTALENEDKLPVRIINLTSSYHAMGPKEGILFENLNWDDAKTPKYNPGLGYGHSKFANVVFTKELAKRIKDHGLEGKMFAASVHPGFVDTELTRHVQKRYGGLVIRFFKWYNGALSVQDGALTQLYCAVSSEPVESKLQGEYFVPIAQHSELDKRAPKITEEMQNKLWEISEKLTGVSFDIKQ